MSEKISLDSSESHFYFSLKKVSVISLQNKTFFYFCI